MVCMSEKGTLYRGEKIWMLKDQSNMIEGEIGTTCTTSKLHSTEKSRGELHVSYSEHER